MFAEQSLDAGDLKAALATLQGAVRREPGNVKYRIFLFQLMAVMGQWPRALTQLSVAGELDAAAMPMVQTYREAIQCEALRAAIFSGARSPLVFGEPPAWLGAMVEALKLDAAGEGERAAAVRSQALELAPAVGGSIDGERFAWLADADCSLGPILEAVINGRYFWIPFERIARIAIEAPADLRDAVWMPAAFNWTNGAETVGLIPTRYQGTVGAGHDSLLLSRRTEWIGEGALAGRGLGQRCFVSDAGEYALMDVRAIAFDTQPAAQGAPQASDESQHG